MKQQEAFVTKVIQEEEEAFLRTLEKGLKRIEAIIAASDKIIKGRDAFELNDTYGFPLDLTQLIAAERGLQVDVEGFTKAREEQQGMGREARAMDIEDWVVLKDNTASEFVGYDLLETEASVVKYRKVKTKSRESYQIVLDKTPFYAESGGQVGDTGELLFGSERLPIVNTKKKMI